MRDEKPEKFEHVPARIELGRGLVIGADAPSAVEPPPVNTTLPNNPPAPRTRPPAPGDTEIVHGMRRRKRVRKG